MHKVKLRHLFIINIIILISSCSTDFSRTDWSIYVIDFVTNQPIAGVTAIFEDQIIGGTISRISDEKGFAMLSTPKNSPATKKVTCSMAGYISSYVIVNPNTTETVYMKK